MKKVPKLKNSTIILPNNYFILAGMFLDGYHIVNFEYTILTKEFKIQKIPSNNLVSQIEIFRFYFSQINSFNFP